MHIVTLRKHSIIDGVCLGRRKRKLEIHDPDEDHHGFDAEQLKEHDEHTKVPTRPQPEASTGGCCYAGTVVLSSRKRDPGLVARSPGADWLGSLQCVVQVKNIERIELGKYEMETWYFSPLPSEFKDCKVGHS